MGHGHDHGHAHGHGPDRSADARALGWVLGLTAGFAVAEVVGGLVADSLALLADAAHMVSDVASLALALVAIWLARRPASARMSFGLRRAEILAALANGVGLIAVAIWIWVEAVGRLSSPVEVEGGTTLVIGLAGLVVNAAGAAILWRSGGSSLNVRAALFHVVGDLLGSIGVVVSAVLVLTLGWTRADPVIAILIGVLIVISSWRILRESVEVLLEGTPAGIDAEAVGRRMAAMEGVTEVHDLHIWTITSGFPALSAHVLVGQGEDCHARRRELAAMLDHDFGIGHSTLQVEHGGGRGRLLEVSPRSDPSGT
ncbi:MAG TPA: cation diffusion facilitator family transporter [Miltoncostaea sp.]|nr:cation diffusion facilitator family transporter [Miltoncostaea sp.]